jgi:hypothetical protein
MNDRLMTDNLAERVLGWRVTPDRFMTGERSWISRSRFRPFTDIRDALLLADSLSRHYSLTSNPDGFTAEVNYRGRLGRATAKQKERAITLAIARVLDINPPPATATSLNCTNSVENAIQTGARD